MTDLDTRLRAADRIDAPDLWPDIASRRTGPLPGRDPGPGRRVAAAAVALAVATAGAYLMVRTFGGTGREAPAPATEAPSGDLPAVELRVTGVVDVGGPIGSVEAGDGTVWAAVQATDGDGGRVIRLDPATGEILLEATVGSVPLWEVGGQGMAVAEGTLWVGGGNDRGGAVLAVDVTTGRTVREAALGSDGFVEDVAVTEEEIWVLQSGAEAPRLVRLDLRTLEETGAFPLPASYTRQVVVAGGGVWVHEREVDGPTVTDSVLVKIDPTDGSVVAEVELPGYGAGFEAVGDSLLAASSESDAANLAETLVRVDARTGERLAEHPLGRAIPGRELFAAGPDGAVWLVGSEQGPTRLYRFDTVESRVDATLDLPEDLTPTALVATPSAVWIANYEGSVTRVEVRPSS